MVWSNGEIGMGPESEGARERGREGRRGEI